MVQAHVPRVRLPFSAAGGDGDEVVVRGRCGDLNFRGLSLLGFGGKFELISPSSRIRSGSDFGGLILGSILEQNIDFSDNFIGFFVTFLII